ncbi:3-keto-disaccharide hydrolase [Aeoliella sp. SH292]|uniref:3-keto-disaccharide hydrolase n=1 Tax=Aeoliella sp. SH292 TaxID=3454464 RepID=UPI003F9E681A
MRRCLCPSLVLVAMLFSAVSFAEEKWRPLFNGKDLQGWTPKIRYQEAGDNFANTFRVEDGVLKVGYDEYEEFGARFGHLFFDEEFSNYRLRAQYRIVGDQVKGGAGWAQKNSGIMIHGQKPETMAIDQEFPVSIEVQLLSGLGGGIRPTANLCTPGTHVVMNGKLHTDHCTNSKSQTFGDEWVEVELEVHGSGKIKHFVNGELVMEYEQPQYDPRDATAKPLVEARKDGNLLIDRGTISIQSESHPVEFRKIEILELEE